MLARGKNQYPVAEKRDEKINKINQGFEPNIIAQIIDIGCENIGYRHAADTRGKYFIEMKM